MWLPVSASNKTKGCVLKFYCEDFLELEEKCETEIELDIPENPPWHMMLEIQLCKYL